MPTFSTSALWCGINVAEPLSSPTLQPTGRASVASLKPSWPRPQDRDYTRATSDNCLGGKAITLLVTTAVSLAQHWAWFPLMVPLDAKLHPLNWQQRWVPPGAAVCWRPHGHMLNLCPWARQDHGLAAGSPWGIPLLPRVSRLLTVQPPHHLGAPNAQTANKVVAGE